MRDALGRCSLGRVRGAFENIGVYHGGFCGKKLDWTV
jgi:hypothetical protein